MRPIKRRNGELAEKVPLFFEEGDGGGSDAFAALERLNRLESVPSKDRARTPLFRVDRAALTVSQLRSFAGKLMRTAGQKSAKVGAHSFRIGGATELADQGASQLLLQAKRQGAVGLRYRPHIRTGRSWRRRG